MKTVPACQAAMLRVSRVITLRLYTEIKPTNKNKNSLAPTVKVERGFFYKKFELMHFLV
jgi:hypothetical protein